MAHDGNEHGVRPSVHVEGLARSFFSGGNSCWEHSTMQHVAAGKFLACLSRHEWMGAGYEFHDLMHSLYMLWPSVQ